MLSRKWRRGAWAVALGLCGTSGFAVSGANSVAPAATLIQPAATLIQDVETGVALPAGASPYDLAEMGGILYYGAWDVAHGYELWRSDGTPAGTFIVADIQPGQVGSLPRHLTVVGSELFFVANDGHSGFGLWKSDGTGAGTRLLHAGGAVPGTLIELYEIGQLQALGSLLIFTARNRTLGYVALWRSDGTPAGTQEVKALGWQFARPRLRPVVIGAHAYVMAYDVGRELWRTDGTTAGTQVAWNGLPGEWEWPDVSTAFLGRVVFAELQPGSGTPALRSVDGLTGNAITLAALSRADWFTQVGATLFFSTGCALWKTDGTPAGTQELRAFPMCGVRALAPVGGKLVFAAQVLQGASARTLLHVSDGSVAGTQALFDVEGADVTVLGAGTRAFWVARRAWPSGLTYGVLGVSDGTPAGTSVVRDDFTAWYSDDFLNSPARPALSPLSAGTLMTVYQGQALFRAQSRNDRARWHAKPVSTLWRSDGTPAGTRPLFAPPLRTRGSWPEQFTDGGGGRAVFATSLVDERPPAGGGGVVRLMRSDGTPGGTTTLATFNYGPGTCDSSFGWVHSETLCRLHWLTRAGNRVFFVRDDGVEARLWSIDPASGGAVPLHAFPPPDTALISGLGEINGRVLFHADGSLWSSDGTAAGTQPIGQVDEPEPRALLFTRVGATLFFSTPGFQFGGPPGALWKTDGTPGSVQLLKALHNIGELIDVAGTLYFTSNGELWKSNGTPAGTVLVAATQAASRLTALGTRVLFSACDALHGCELWTSDGSADGTHMVADMLGGWDSSNPDGFVVLGARVVFSAANSVFGREPWISDGTREGTLPLGDLHPGRLGSLDAGPIFASDGARVFFPAFTPGAGVELWSSDGTPGGTALVQDIAPGAAGSHPRELAVIGSRLFFSADDGLHGQEPWSLTLGASAEREGEEVFR